MKYTCSFVAVALLIGAVTCQSSTITGTGSCIVPTVGPSETVSDPSLTWPTFISSGPAHSDNTKSGTPSAATPTCQHAADPDGAMGLCPNLSNNGWCECNGADYPIMPGTAPCAYTTLPPTITLSSTSCSSTALATTTSACVVPAGCTNAAAPTGCAVACT